MTERLIQNKKIVRSRVHDKGSCFDEMAIETTWNLIQGVQTKILEPTKNSITKLSFTERNFVAPCLMIFGY
jgi:hypothetical protein